MCWPSKRSRASRMSSQGGSLLSPVRDARTARIDFSTVGPKRRSTAWSVALRLLSLRGRSPDRSVEPFDSRVGEEVPADDGVRLRVVRSTLQHATSARGDAKLSPLRSRDCPEQLRRGQERYVYNGHRTYNKALASSPVQTSWSRTEVDRFSWTPDSADRIVVDRPIPTGFDRRRRDVAVALPPSEVGLGR